MTAEELVYDLNNNHFIFDDVIFIINNSQKKLSKKDALKYIKKYNKTDKIDFEVITNTTVKNEFTKLGKGSSWYDPKFYDDVDFQMVIDLFDKNDTKHNTLKKCIDSLFPDESVGYDVENSY